MGDDEQDLGAHNVIQGPWAERGEQQQEQSLPEVPFTQENERAFSEFLSGLEGDSSPVMSAIVQGSPRKLIMSVFDGPSFELELPGNGDYKLKPTPETAGYTGEESYLQVLDVTSDPDLHAAVKAMAGLVKRVEEVPVNPPGVTSLAERQDSLRVGRSIMTAVVDKPQGSAMFTNVGDVIRGFNRPSSPPPPGPKGTIRPIR